MDSDDPFSLYIYCMFCGEVGFTICYLHINSIYNYNSYCALTPLATTFPVFVLILSVLIVFKSISHPKWNKFEFTKCNYPRSAFKPLATTFMSALTIQAVPPPPAYNVG